MAPQGKIMFEAAQEFGGESEVSKPKTEVSREGAYCRTKLQPAEGSGRAPINDAEQARGLNSGQSPMQSDVPSSSILQNPKSLSVYILCIS